MKILFWQHHHLDAKTDFLSSYLAHGIRSNECRSTGTAHSARSAIAAIEQCSRASSVAMADACPVRAMQSGRENGRMGEMEFRPRRADPCPPREHLNARPLLWLVSALAFWLAWKVRTANSDELLCVCSMFHAKNMYRMYSKMSLDEASATATLTCPRSGLTSFCRTYSILIPVLSCTPLHHSISTGNLANLADPTDLTSSLGKACIFLQSHPTPSNPIQSNPIPSNPFPIPFSQDPYHRCQTWPTYRVQ